jgi:hypothetical protein
MFRGKVTAVTDAGVYVLCADVASTPIGPCQAVTGPYAVGDMALVVNVGTDAQPDLVVVGVIVGGSMGISGLDAVRGLAPGVTTLNKFGQAPDGVQTTATDIWSRANASATQQIWLPPTTARVHAIASSSTSDDGDPAGVGARTVRVYGLTAWSTAETSEVVTLNGTGAVNTANAYVIIHRMKVLTSGASGPNVGTITATAATDTTITAVILPGLGQTEMAIYGVASGRSLYLTRWSAQMDKITGATPVSANLSLLICENPTADPRVYLRKHDLHLQSTGTSAYQATFDPPIKYAGPCIVKVQASATAADTDISSQFDGYLVED